MNNETRLRVDTSFFPCDGTTVAFLSVGLLRPSRNNVCGSVRKIEKGREGKRREEKGREQQYKGKSEKKPRSQVVVDVRTDKLEASS